MKKDQYLQKRKVFVAHGEQDSKLPIYYAKQAKDYIESLGISLSYHEFTLGHQISSLALQHLNDWIRN